MCQKTKLKGRDNFFNGHQFGLLRQWIKQTLKFSMQTRRPDPDILPYYKAINEKSPHALYPNSSETKRCRLKTNIPFGSPTTKVYSCGLACWFLQSPLIYGPERKGLKRESFQWKGTCCNTLGEFQLEQFCQFTLQGRAKLSMASCILYR